MESVRFLSPDIAIAHVTSEASFVQDGKEVTRTGRATAILVTQEGKWLITAFHNTLTSGPGGLVPKSSACLGVHPPIVPRHPASETPACL
jgi:hypothetical protein